jgi:hypothetical protein
MNVGGFDFGGGVGRRLANDPWLNLGVVDSLDLEREIGLPEHSLFPGKYGGRGVRLGIGLRW